MILHRSLGASLACRTAGRMDSFRRRNRRGWSGARLRCTARIHREAACPPSQHRPPKSFRNAHYDFSELLSALESLERLSSLRDVEHGIDEWGEASRAVFIGDSIELGIIPHGRAHDVPLIPE